MLGAFELLIDDASAFVAAAARLAAQPVADQDGAEDAVEVEGAEGLDPNLVEANDWRCCLLATPHMLQRSTGIK